MKILLINGGYDLDDPSTKVTNLYEEVLTELQVEVTRVDLHKKIPQIQGLSMILEDCQGVIIISTSKWVGVSALMQQFLEICFEAGQDLFKDKYGLIVSLATKNGEDYALNHLIKSWLALSGFQPETLSGVIPTGNVVDNNENIKTIFEKKIEDFYRVVKGKRGYLPTSLNNAKTIITVKEDKTENNISLNEIDTIDNSEKPIEEDYLEEKHKKDIFEITKLFKNKLTKIEENPGMAIIKQRLESVYSPEIEVNNLTYSFVVTAIKPFNFTIKLGDKLIIEEGKKEESNIHITMDEKELYQILDGKVSMQNAFVLGKITVKGQIGLLNVFDQCFKL